MTSIDVEIPDAAAPGQIGVYVVFDAADEVLYIGRTKDLGARMRQHRSTAPWFRETRRIEFTPCDGPHEARALEKSMIATFRPESNINDTKLPPAGRHLLPDWTVALLVEMHEAEVAAGTRREATLPERHALNGYILAIREAGWSLASVGFALGVSREAIRQRETDAPGPLRTLDVPALPQKAKPPKKVRPVVPADVLAEMLTLREEARTVNGVTPLDHPSRAASLRLTELMAEQVTNGVAISRVAQQLGVTHLAVKSRLVRHGYDTTTSESACFQAYGKVHPLLTSERATTCKRGHSLTDPANVRYVNGDPTKRQCRACCRVRSQEYHQRRTAAADSP